MITLSTESFFFIAVMALAPIALRNNSKYRRYIFLIINLAVFLVSMTSVSMLIVGALWILAPYFLAGVFAGDDRRKYRWILFTVMVAVFAYLARYEALFNILHIPLVFGWRLLGLSYFLFRQIDFIMQYEYLKEEGVAITLTDYLNYILSFYTLLAGPILRYRDFVLDMERQVDPLTKEEILTGLNRAVNGYIKVYAFSGIAGYLAKSWFDGLGNHSGVLTTAGAFFLFAFFNGWYIYFNFSGYCDIVISFAQLSGLTVKENFNRPYLARSVAEFWNRHHISLSEWIRDYIYSPLFKAFLSGPFSKNPQAGQYLALFLTFTVAGIWHGTDINYLVYGLFQGLGIVVATAFKAYRKKHFSKEKNKAWEKNHVATWAGRCITWSYICLTFSFVGYDVVGLLR